MTDLAILIPVLGRPHHIEPLLASIHDTCDADVFFGVTGSDEDLLAATDGMNRVVVPGPFPGDYARKINLMAGQCDHGLLFLGASDIKFHPGWYEAATAKLTEGIGVVGTNDLGSRRVMQGRHSTHSLVTRDYMVEFGTIDEPGKILHEGYIHEFVDDELVETAKHRNAWAMAKNSIVEHLHPNWGKAPSDALYEDQRRRMRAGRVLFNQRRPLWM